MCGIFAFIGSGQTVDSLTPYYLKTQHRGPDHSIIQRMPVSKTQSERQELRAVLLEQTPENEVRPDLEEPERFLDHHPQPIFGFHRLMVNGLTAESNQPLEQSGVYLICNGEIYNKDLLVKKYRYRLETESDCEVILHLYRQHGIEQAVQLLDGVFAFVLYDTVTSNVYAVRDPIGVRPMFIGKLKKELQNAESNESDEVAPENPKFQDSFVFSSELKSCHDLCDQVDQFPPGQIWSPDHGFHVYWTSKPTATSLFGPRQMKLTAMKRLFEEAVRKRLMSDRPVGVLLSGGLDSSLVAALVKKALPKDQVLHSFSIGISTTPGSTEESPDLQAAQKVADHLGTQHHTITFTPEEGLAAIPEVIRSLETYDITTIRASTPMYLLSKYIAEQTDIRVILSGEGADELFGGYLYFHQAPSPHSFQEETQRLLTCLHRYDVLRADRVTAAHGLEVRVPFLDREFMNVVLTIDAKEKWCQNTDGQRLMHRATLTPQSLKAPENLPGTADPTTKESTRIEKKILREVFEDLLPAEIIWRAKDGMSDAVGYSWVDTILDHAETNITHRQLNRANRDYPKNTPESKEAIWYRQVFEELYPAREQVLREMWLPRWNGEQIDPSARRLDQFKISVER